jgi:hypothetical protein
MLCNRGATGLPWIVPEIRTFSPKICAASPTNRICKIAVFISVIYPKLMIRKKRPVQAGHGSLRWSRLACSPRRDHPVLLAAWGLRGEA